MSKHEADKKLKGLTKLFIKGFEEHSEEFSFKDMRDMQKMADWMIDIMINCIKEDVSPRVAYVIFKVMSEYSRVVFEESERV